MKNVEMLERSLSKARKVEAAVLSNSDDTAAWQTRAEACVNAADAVEIALMSTPAACEGEVKTKLRILRAAIDRGDDAYHIAELFDLARADLAGPFGGASLLD